MKVNCCLCNFILSPGNYSCSQHANSNKGGCLLHTQGEPADEPSAFFSKESGSPSSPWKTTRILKDRYLRAVKFLLSTSVNYNIYISPVRRRMSESTPMYGEYQGNTASK